MIRALLVAALLLPALAQAQTTLYPTGGSANAVSVALTAGRGGSALTSTGTSVVCGTDPSGTTGTGQTWGDAGPYGPILLNQSITFNVRASESSTSANLGVRCTAYYVSGGSPVQLCQTGTSSELGTSQGARTVSCTPNSNIPNGAYIRAFCRTEAIATVAGLDTTCYNDALYWNGPTPGASGDSYMTFAQTLPPPITAPTSASITPSGGTASTINLSWTANNSPTGYNVYRSAPNVDSGFTLIYSGAGTSTTDTGLTFNTTYYYYVVASNSAGSFTSAHVPGATSNPTVATGATLAWNRTEPIRELGGTITFTATGTGSTLDGSATPQGYYRFKFWRWTAATGWVVMLDWAVTNTYVYTPIVYGAGATAEAESWAVHAYIPSNPGQIGYGNEIAFTTYPSPITGHTLTPDRASQTAAPGEIVTWTATGTGSIANGSALPQNKYEFRFWRHDGIQWHIDQDWSTDNTYPWTATLGTYEFAIHARLKDYPPDAIYPGGQPYVVLESSALPVIMCQ